jgi:lysophospholipid hydrolase
MYARLPPEPQRKELQIDLPPDTQEGDSKPGLANYLDEFLSAIKIFGYLERPVFHELTRSMQTRKLIAGETLLLEEEKGFCLVVDGLVQIFVKSNREGRDSDSEPSSNNTNGEYTDEGEDHYEEGNQGYQLLTEVKNGAPMSSLFSILSLFTEDVKLRHTDDDNGEMGSSSSTPGYNQSNFQSALGTRTGESTSEPEQTSPPPQTPLGPPSHRDRHPSTLISSTAIGHLPAIPPLSLDNPLIQQRDSRSHHPFYQVQSQSSSSRPKKAKSVHPDIVARATVDTTIAIVPASAFRRLTRVYPKATAHIVQVILTRLQRVTLSTGHSYLGLTSEVLRTEKHMDKYTTYELPNFLRGGALERLKEKFFKEKERIGPEEGMKGIALHNGRAGQRRRSTSANRIEAAAQTRLAITRGAPNLSSRKASAIPPKNNSNCDANAVSAGDLLANIQISRHGVRQGYPTSEDAPTDQPFREAGVLGAEQQSPLTQRSFNPFLAMPMRNDGVFHPQESLDEDSIFRESVLECIFKAIGLTSTKNVFRKTDSVEQSPRLVSYDSRRQKAVFNNAFGFIDPYEGSADGDSESLTSVSISAASIGGSPGTSGLNSELRDDVEIVYFPKGSVLVEQGERNPGLYYVIDGFLDVSIPTDEHSAESNVLGTMHSSTESAPDNFELLTRTGTSSSFASNLATGLPNSGRRKRKARRKSLFLIKPGGIAGYVGTISSYRSFIDVRAKTDVYVGFLPRSSLERIVEKYPVVLLTMAKRLTSLLPRLILHIDFALEWVQVNAGQVIYHQNDESDAIYIVLNGRLRAILENEDGGMRVVGEYGQGESVGELEVMTETTRPATLHAIRDTELAKFPKTLFNSLALEHPGITIKISKIIASRMRALIEDPLSEQGKDSPRTARSTNVTSTVNLRTVAILPVTAGVPVVEFASRLMNALTQIGSPNDVTTLNHAAILNHLGRHAFSRMGKLKLSQYLADLEEKYEMVLYVADTSVNAPWTQTCISQADCILLIGLAEGSSDIGEYERFLVGMKTTARKELVLLHVDRYSPAGLTRRWLRVGILLRAQKNTKSKTNKKKLLEPYVDQWRASPHTNGIQNRRRASTSANKAIRLCLKGTSPDPSGRDTEVHVPEG